MDWFRREGEGRSDGMVRECGCMCMWRSSVNTEQAAFVGLSLGRRCRQEIEGLTYQVGRYATNIDNTTSFVGFLKTLQLFLRELFTFLQFRL